MTVCPHTSLVPQHAPEGFLCTKCETLLPPNHFCPDCEKETLVDAVTFEFVRQVTTRPCELHRNRA